MIVSDFSTLWTPKLDSVGGSYNGQLSRLHRLNTATSATYSQGKRQAHLHLTDPMTSKSTLKKVQNLFMDQSTPCPPQNSQPCGNSSRNIPGVESSTQVSLHGAPPFYSSKRKMAASAYAWISMP